VTVNPHWLLTAGLLILFAIFAGGVIAAAWLALSPDPDAVSE
jgi:hypothetical protein